MVHVARRRDRCSDTRLDRLHDLHDTVAICEYGVPFSAAVEIEGPVNKGGPSDMID